MSDFPRQVVEGRTARPRVGLVLGPQEGPGSLPLFNLNKCTCERGSLIVKKKKKNSVVALPEGQSRP